MSDNLLASSPYNKNIAPEESRVTGYVGRSVTFSHRNFSSNSEHKGP